MLVYSFESTLFTSLLPSNEFHAVDDGLQMASGSSSSSVGSRVYGSDRHNLLWSDMWGSIGSASGSSHFESSVPSWLASCSSCSAEHCDGRLSLDAYEDFTEDA